MHSRKLSISVHTIRSIIRTRSRIQPRHMYIRPTGGGTDSPDAVENADEDGRLRRRNAFVEERSPDRVDDASPNGVESCSNR